MSRQIIAYYRISDRGFAKVKPQYINNKNCLNNFVKNFEYDALYIIADNVKEETFQILQERYHDKYTELIRTKLDNRRSFIFAFDHAIKNFNDDDIIYFVENDYVHCQGASQVLAEGLEIADYVTLYDHPDKYLPEYKDSWPTSCYKTKNSHWVLVPSTPMTFGTTVRSLKQDSEMFDNIIRNNNDTHTNSKAFFNTIAKYNNKKLATPIPSMATHGETEWLAPFINWMKIIVTMITLIFAMQKASSCFPHPSIL